MKVGDLVRIPRPDSRRWPCPEDDCRCWFCCNNSNGFGVVIEELGSNHPYAVKYWRVQFDAGEWDLWTTEVEMVNEV